VGRDLDFEKSTPGTFQFTLPDADNYYMQLPGLGYYVHIWVDPVAGIAPPTGDDVINVANNGCKPNSKSACTSVLQQLITRISGHSEQSTIYFPAGEYLTDALLIAGSSMRIHLDPGAVLRYTNSSRAQIHPASDPLPGFLTLNAAAGVNITGRGTIDANSYSVETANQDGAHGLYLLNSTNMRVQDIHIMGGQCRLGDPHSTLRRGDLQ
jgi:polygalacturonase